MRKVVVTFLLLAAPALADEQTGIGYPNGYRQWTHVKSTHIRSGHPLHHLFGGVNHIYANKPALAGYKKGKFPNGATLVLDVLEARDDGFAVSEGARKIVAVMHKDTRKYPQTGGWGFEAWRGDNRKQPLVGKDAGAQCFGCHAQQPKTDYVFSKYRL
jgi:Cytochrome P460